VNGRRWHATTYPLPPYRTTYHLGSRRLAAAHFHNSSPAILSAFSTSSPPPPQTYSIYAFCRRASTPRPDFHTTLRCANRRRKTHSISAHATHSAHASTPHCRCRLQGGWGAPSSACFTGETPTAAFTVVATRTATRIRSLYPHAFARSTKHHAPHLPHAPRTFLPALSPTTCRHLPPMRYGAMRRCHPPSQRPHPCSGRILLPARATCLPFADLRDSILPHSPRMGPVPVHACTNGGAWLIVGHGTCGLTLDLRRRPALLPPRHRYKHTAAATASHLTPFAAMLWRVVIYVLYRCSAKP